MHACMGHVCYMACHFFPAMPSNSECFCEDEGCFECACEENDAECMALDCILAGESEDDDDDDECIAVQNVLACILTEGNDSLPCRETPMCRQQPDLCLGTYIMCITANLINPSANSAMLV